MNKKYLNKNKFALSLGIFSALLHAVWALAVAIGLGQKFFDFVFPLHFINSIYSVVEFSFSKAIMLIVMAFICTYIMSFVLAAIYNWVHEK